MFSVRSSMITGERNNFKKDFIRILLLSSINYIDISMNIEITSLFKNFNPNSIGNCFLSFGNFVFVSSNKTSFEKRICLFKFWFNYSSFQSNSSINIWSTMNNHLNDERSPRTSQLCIRWLFDFIDILLTKTSHMRRFLHGIIILFNSSFSSPYKSLFHILLNKITEMMNILKHNRSILLLHHQ